MPRPYIIEDSAPNAFATGRDPQHAAIAVTRGLLDKLNGLELEGVVAHEAAHVQNYDIRLMTLVTVLVGTVVLLSDWMMRSLWYGGRRRRRSAGRGGGNPLVLIGLVFVILSPIIARRMRSALSRQREFPADASGALLTRYPEGLASALEKLTADKEPLGVANTATAHLYIINPLAEYRGKLNSLFSTHPPLDERVKRLRGREGKWRGLGGRLRQHATEATNRTSRVSCIMARSTHNAGNSTARGVRPTQQILLHYGRNPHARESVDELRCTTR